jgi:MoaA/NifB/PqqE/SkfB family radical SAM enzyme
MGVNKIIDNLKSNLSNRQKAFLRFGAYLIKNPIKIRSHINYLSYANKVLQNDNIKYTPPVFIATISDTCNLRCPTCLYLLENPEKFINSFLTVDKFKDILQKYNAHKIAKVIFLSGGEPLLHPHFDQLIDISRDYDLIPKISTNGILIRKHIHALKKVDYVNVSLDAYNYGSFRVNRGGTERQFENIIEGIKLLKANNINFSLSFLLSADNVSEVSAMLEFAAKLEPNFVNLHNINPHGNTSVKPLTITNNEAMFFINKIISKKDYQFDIMMGVIFNPGSETFLTERCIQPWFYLCFNPVGDIAYCCHLAHNNNIGNVWNGYNFNSPKMNHFRTNMIKGTFPKSCLYCQRRFMGKGYAIFNARNQEWWLSEDAKSQVT